MRYRWATGLGKGKATMSARLRARRPDRTPDRRNGGQSSAAALKQQALEQRDQLKHSRDAGVVDWGSGRRPECRYEAYWRGMSIGLFPTEDEAWSYLRGLDSLSPRRADPRPPRGDSRASA